MSVSPAPQGVPVPGQAQTPPASPASPAVPAGSGPRTVAAHRDAVEDLLRRWFLAHPPAQESVALDSAAGRLLAEEVRAPGNLPPFTNSQMDGYAVRTADLAAGNRPPGAPAMVPLATAAPIPAGSAPPPLLPGTAAPVMTGAMLPEGADAVVPIEACIPDSFLPSAGPGGTVPAGGAAGTVEVPAQTPAGQFVRRAGSDIAAGAPALPAGTVLGPLQLGLLAGLGLDRLTVRARPRVLLLTTGDEVREPGRPLEPGQIHDANTTLLRSSLEEAGAEVLRSRILADSPQEFIARLRADVAADAPDLVLTSGGISKGAYEVVRQGLAAHEVAFLSVAMQPGGPQGIGTVDGVPFLGFPGNPVSSLVSFEMFLRPALTAVTGAPRPRTEVQARLTAPLGSPAGKHQIRRGRYTAGTVEPVGGPGSHLLHALAASNALIPVPVGTEHLEAGAEVTVLLLE
ncbi:molybdopterin molybdenumtransferase MoeA [Arthrobacter yangruifuii]|uniref:Molybdopterin molybdenumtransferase n=1 Tax=Arthrobacter yangruifuii TaxID=2606616 RepID=A0A5N6MGE7_9MICC|nr:gephyrin-like molybdotransferase Glp [Arthrobacter yangruifuii]KAD3515394.1 molybdopterin molybdenumtransferase MoeA [Arthrobacter yangruifuii]